MGEEILMLPTFLRKKKRERERKREEEREEREVAGEREAQKKKNERKGMDFFIYFTKKEIISKKRDWTPLFFGILVVVFANFLFMQPYVRATA